MKVENTKLFKLVTKDSKEKENAKIVRDIRTASAEFNLMIIQEETVVEACDNKIEDAMCSFPIDFSNIVDLQRKRDLAVDKVSRLNDLFDDLFSEGKKKA